MTLLVDEDEPDSCQAKKPQTRLHKMLSLTRAFTACIDEI